jgi:hypothetical protein
MTCFSLLFMYSKRASTVFQELALDPLLQTVMEKVPFLQVFSRWIYTAILSANTISVKCWQVEVLQTVGQTFMAMGFNDPCLRSNVKNYHQLLKILHICTKKDPSSNGVIKSVLVQVLHHIVTTTTAERIPENSQDWHLLSDSQVTRNISKLGYYSIIYRLK